MQCLKDPSIGKYLNRESKGAAQERSWGADDTNMGYRKVWPRSDLWCQVSLADSPRLSRSPVAASPGDSSWMLMEPVASLYFSLPGFLLFFHLLSSFAPVSGRGVRHWLLSTSQKGKPTLKSAKGKEGLQLCSLTLSFCTQSSHGSQHQMDPRRTPVAIQWEPESQAVYVT